MRASLKHARAAAKGVGRPYVLHSIRTGTHDFQGRTVKLPSTAWGKGRNWKKKMKLGRLRPKYEEAGRKIFFLPTSSRQLIC